MRRTAEDGADAGCPGAGGAPRPPLGTRSTGGDGHGGGGLGGGSGGGEGSTANVGGAAPGTTPCARPRVATAADSAAATLPASDAMPVALRLVDESV